MRFLSDFPFLSPKVQKMRFLQFLAPGTIFAKLRFSDKKCNFENARTHIPLALFRLWSRRDHKSAILPPKVLFCSKNAFLAKKWILCSKIRICAKSALFGPLPANPCFTNAISINFTPFAPTCAFEPQNALLEPKMHFPQKDAQNGPKRWFWAQNAKNSKSAQKVNSRLSVRLPEHGFPDSGPERIHGRGRQNM